METAVRILAWASIAWAVVVLAYQVIAAGRRRPGEFSQPSGRPGRGVLYNFTFAMAPTRKESARRHAVEFLVGVVLHAGAVIALVCVPVFLLLPEFGARVLVVCRPLFGVSLAAGLVLFLRRLVSGQLRAMSAPDDYLAILLTCGLMATALHTGLQDGNSLLLPAYAVALFFYLPLGKLKHLVFFFAARADFGYRLGYRGVYPPVKMVAEHLNARRR